MINLLKFAEFLQRISSENHGLTHLQIADELDEYGRQLQSSASLIRNGGNPFRSNGGTSDRVRMQVVGPDGEIKKTVQTGR